MQLGGGVIENGYRPGVQWEYMTVVEPVISIDRLEVKLNALGSLGWEAVGLSASDPTIGINQMHVLLKRQALDWPPPGGHDAGVAAWLPDPAGRFDRRFWDGLRWTEHVADASGQQSTDFPNVRR